MAAGKSEALAALERLGAATLSADAVVHDLYSQSAIRDAVVARWGEDVMSEDGINRRAIADRVFADEAERSWLEGLLWPHVGREIAAWHAEQERRRPLPPAIVVEVPLLFESGMNALFDATIAVIADDETRVRRAADRGLGAVDERTGRQLPQADKARRADFVVTNCGTLAELERTLTEVVAKLQA